MYQRVTRGIRISVEPEYQEGQSDPDDDLYVWSYTIRIDNHSAQTVCLRRRRWRITDERGVTEVVDGEGVVGEQPVIGPGDAYEYTSGAPLSTPSGMMVGAYRMETADGEQFEAEIPPFSLDSPYETRRVH